MIIGALEIGLRAFAAVYSTIYDQLIPRLISGSPLYFWFSWSIGALAAEAFLNRQALPFSRVPVWIFPLLTVVSSCVKPLESFSFLLAALSTVSLINLLLTTSATGRMAAFPFVGRHLGFAGIVSYSVYLLHQRMIESVEYFFRTFNPPLHLSPLSIFALCLVSWIPIVLLSWCFYRLIELPSIEFGKMAIRRWVPK